MAEGPVRKEIDEDRAAVLLGLTLAQLRELCEQSGLGRGEAGDARQPRSFTYEELYWICRRVARPAV
jgi:hypothetical protein